MRRTILLPVTLAAVGAFALSGCSAFENLGKSNLLESAVPLGIFTNRYPSDLWLENGAFLRFENLSN